MMGPTGKGNRSWEDSLPLDKDVGIRHVRYWVLGRDHAPNVERTSLQAEGGSMADMGSRKK